MTNKQHEHNHSNHIKEFGRKFWISFVLTIPVLVFSPTVQDILGFSLTFPSREWISLGLSAVIYFYGGYPFLTGLYSEIKQRQPGMMTLIGFAISVAFFYSAISIIFDFGQPFLWELATLVTVMLLGHWIEAKSVSSASNALEELIKIMPTTAHRLKNGEIEEVSVSELKVGDKVLVKPGEKVPSDGKIAEGKSDVNESLVTGESKPVPKKEGSEVIGGSINEEGALIVEIKKTGEETYLSQIIDLVQKSQESKSRSQGTADKAAALLFYIAVSVAIITFIAWTLFGDPVFAIKRAVTVLVISCPHALGLAIPLVIALSTAITSKNGIFVRNRTAFEKARDINAIVFDKTGTLTQGKFGVTDVVPFIDKNELMQLTGAVEKNSEHTLAKAIVKYIKDHGVKIPEVEDFRAISGKGIYGKVRGKKIQIGSPGMIKEMDIDINDDKVQKLMNEGNTVVFTVVDGKLAGAFALADIIREESYGAVKQLKDLGVKTYLVTGDSEAVAKSVADELGINDYFAQVLPDKKAEKIKELKDQGYRVAMVGDGINDAPALVEADVGIAIGAGTDVAMESADITLVKSNPDDVSKVIFFSQKTHAKTIQNLWWAAGYNIAAIPLAAGILYNQGIVISPAVGALLMSLSTVIVAINSQTMRKYMPQ